MNPNLPKHESDKYHIRSGNRYWDLQSLVSRPYMAKNANAHRRNRRSGLESVLVKAADTAEVESCAVWSIEKDTSRGSTAHESTKRTAAIICDKDTPNVSSRCHLRRDRGLAPRVRRRPAKCFVSTSKGSALVEGRAIKQVRGSKPSRSEQRMRLRPRH
jgi:hypothetical protein